MADGSEREAEKEAPCSHSKIIPPALTHVHPTPALTAHLLLGRRLVEVDVKEVEHGGADARPSSPRRQLAKHQLVIGRHPDF